MGGKACNAGPVEIGVQVACSISKLLHEMISHPTVPVET
jgi:hypothetical protein